MIFRDEIVESLTLKFAQTASERRKKGLSIISLGLGEPDFDIPSSIIESTIKVLRTSKASYSDSMGILSLREKISDKLLSENSIKCSAANILVTAGAKQAFQFVCMALLEPGDEVIVINPSFVSFIPQLYIAEPACKVKVVNINKDDFVLDMEKLKYEISSKTKLLIINSPNNPAGYMLSEKDLKMIYTLAEERNFYIISDEVYEKLNFSNKVHASIGSFETEPQRVFTINSFSKSHAMTGWRLGYTCFPSELGQRLLKLQQHINTNTCTFIQQAVAQSFNINNDYLVEYNKKLFIRSERIIQMILKLPRVSLVPPDAGFFAFLNISRLGIDSNTFCSRLIEEKGVATTPGIAFGVLWDDHVRISFATSEEYLEKGMDLICDFIQELK
jgi:aspartate/methionine/tyrosine aminotransferase